MLFYNKKSACLFVSLFLLCFVPGVALSAQNIGEAVFVDKPIRDILLALGQLGGKTVVVDETVNGNATHYLRDQSFDQALKLVLESNRLFAKEEAGVLVVSRVDIRADANGNLTIRAEGTLVETILRRVARVANRTILYDPLPQIPMDLNIVSASFESAVGTIAARLTGYVVEKVEQALYVKSVAVQRQGGDAGLGQTGFSVTAQNGGYTVTGRSVRFSDLIERLFSTAGKEYSMLKRSDSMIDRISFSGKDFDSLLRLVLELGDGDYTIKDGVYYLFDVNRQDILKKFEGTSNIQLKSLSVNQMLNILPSNLVGGNTVKIDRASNSLILSGSPEEIDPIVAFIKDVDRPPTGLEYYRFDLKFVPVDTVVPLLPENLKVMDPIVLKSQNAIMLLLSKERFDVAHAFLTAVDRPQQPKVIPLKYIRADDFVARMPAFLSKEMISVGPDQRYVFFSGSPEQYALAQEQMRYIDIPVPQIKYQVLIVQHTSFNNLGFGTDSVKVSETDDAPEIFDLGNGNFLSALGDLGKALNLNVNVVTSFGLNFATNLIASLQENKAMVLADTVVNALSNQDVSFRNTTTARFRDPETNQDSGEEKGTGVVREIVSGLVVNMKGWVSGDGMITMTISTTFSKASPVTEKGDLPSTFEKIFSTSVRSLSGKPVILGGLVQSDSDNTVTRTPGLGDVPVLGELFKTRSLNDSRTELMIYVIPRIDNPILTDAPLGDTLSYLYHQHAPGAGSQGN